MDSSEMITSSLTIKIVDNIAQAPKYEADTTMLKIVSCIVVGKGTALGNPTVDLQMEDEDGNKFLVMTTASIMELIAGTTAGKKARDSKESNVSLN